MTFLSFNLYFWSMQGYYFYCLIFRKAATQSIISRDWDFTKLGIGGLDKVCFPTFNVYGNNLLHSTGTKQKIKLHTTILRSVANTVWLQPSHFRGDLQFISPHYITTLPSGRLMRRQKKKTSGREYCRICHQLLRARVIENVWQTVKRICIQILESRGTCYLQSTLISYKMLDDSLFCFPSTWQRCIHVFSVILFFCKQEFSNIIRRAFATRLFPPEVVDKLGENTKSFRCNQ